MKVQKTKYINPDIGQIDLPGYEGKYYDAMAPDTLDLAERAALAINGLTGPTDPDADYEVYFRVHFLSNPVVMMHNDSSICEAKFWQALPLVRLMSGSSQDLNVEKVWAEKMLKMQAPDGLLYYPLKNRPWAVPEVADSFGVFDHLPEGDFCPVGTMSRAIGAMCIYAQLDESGPWKDAVIKFVDAINLLAVGDDEFACMPENPIEPGKKPVYKDNPKRFFAGYNGWTVQSLVQCYRSFGYAPAVDLARRLLNYIMQKGDYFLPSGEFLPERTPQDGFSDTNVDVTATSDEASHFHCHVNTLMALLDYIEATQDKQHLEYAIRIYNFAVAKGQSLLGFFPEWLGKNAKPYAQTSESCQVADMVTVAIKLALLGEDRCWDDVDRWVRNQFVENQLTEYEWINRQAADLPPSKIPDYASGENVAQRNLGAFAGWPSLNDWVWYPQHDHAYTRGIMHCCTGNAARAIYYAWKNILSFDNNVLKVNLLLNRASQWADIDSHIPYKGQVDIKIKEPCDQVAVRIPEWTKPGDCKCTIDDENCTPDWDVRYAVFKNIKPGQIITLNFPISETTHELWCEKNRYKVICKGNDVVHIDPPGQNHPLYQRAHYRQNETRWHNVKRFIPDQLINW